MKICMMGVTRQFPMYSGETTRIVALGNKLIQNGNDVNIIVPRTRHQTITDKVEHTSAVLHEVNQRVPAENYYSSILPQVRAFRRLNKRYHFDILHIHMFYAGLFSILIKPGTKTKILWDTHDWNYYDFFSMQGYIPKSGLLRGIFQSYELASTKLVDGIAVTSELLKETLVKRGVDISKLFVIPNGVDCKSFLDPAPPQDISWVKDFSKIGEGTKVILYVGHLLKYQGVNTLIESIPFLSSDKEIRVLIVGKGPERKNLEKIVKNKKLSEEVQFLGFVTSNQLKACIQMADIAVAPFLYNAYTRWIQPIKVLEYFAGGVPVIASNLEATSELVQNNESGLLFNPGKPRSLATKIDLLLSDKSLAKRLSSVATDLIRTTYNWDIVTKKLESAYNALVN